MGTPAVAFRLRDGMRFLRVDSALRRDFTWVLSGNVIYYACQWAIVIVLAKLGRPEQVGEYALGVAIASPVVLFANLQLRSILASDVKERYSFEQYFGFRLTSLGAALLVVLCIVIGSGYSWRSGASILLVGVALALESLSDIYYALMQKRERMDRISRSLMVKGPLALLSMATCMYFGRSVTWALAGLLLARVAVMARFDSRLDFRRGDGADPIETNRPEWNSRMMRALFWKSLPLGLISTLAALNTYLPRYFIEADWNKRELGIFSAMASLLGAGSLVVTAMGQSSFLPMAKAYANRDRPRLRSLRTHLVMVGAAMGAAGVAASLIGGREILMRVFRPEYASGSDAFVRLMIAGGISYTASCQGYALTAIGRLRPQLPILICTGLATLAGCYLLIPGRGISGAADAAIIGAIVQLAGTTTVLSRAIGRMGTEDAEMALEQS